MLVKADLFGFVFFPFFLGYSSLKCQFVLWHLFNRLKRKPEKPNNYDTEKDTCNSSD